MATKTIKKSIVEEPMPVVVPVEPVRQRSMAERLFPLMFVLMLVMSFALGSLWTKATYLQNLPTTTTATAAQPGTVAPAAVQVSRDQIKDLFSKDVIKFGNADAKLLLVEIADPSCPYCHAAAGHNSTLSKQMGTQFELVSDGGTYVSPVQEMKKLVDSGKASFAWVYSNGHGNGEVATKALYCAFDQGKFWQAHDLLMSSAGYDLINTTVKNDMSKSGDISTFLAGVLNANDLKSCIDSKKYDARLTSEQQLSQTLGVSGTPGFFINEKNFAGAYSWNDMKSDAEAAL